MPLNMKTIPPEPTSHPKSLTLILALFLAGAGPAWAATIAFDELPAQAVNGLTFQNVSFKFSLAGVPSTDATFNSNALGANTTLNLQSPTLEGNASGLLTLDFAQPISIFSFDLARLTSQNLPGATVSLFDSSLTEFAVTPVSVAKIATFSEGHFAYTGGTAVRRAVLSFPAAAGPRFAIDNLISSVIPEPGSMLFGLGLAAFCASVRRRSR